MTTDRYQRSTSFWSAFGPGLLWAAAAIGVSHLVQSTRAGATAGLGLAGVILVALVLKYPFFEYGPRYSAATGQSLVEGYRDIGRWALWLYFLFTLSTAVIIQAAVILFTAFLINYVFAITWPIPVTAGVLMLGCALLLWIGRFAILDGAVKVILVILALSTIVAAVVTIGRVDFSTIAMLPDVGATRGAVSFAFLLALVGWMPSTVEVSVWSSLWTLAKNETIGGRTSVKHARTDFFVGYVTTGFLAFGFLILGAGVMFASGTEFSAAGTVFSTQLVQLYSTTLGEWTRPIVLIAVLTTMLSTSLAVVDGFPRAIERTVKNLKPRHTEGSGMSSAGAAYWTALLMLAGLTVVVLWVFVGNLTSMVDFATIVSFLTAPVFGYLNLRAVTSADVEPEHRPGWRMILLSWVGLALLGGTAIVFLVYLVT